MKRKRRRPPPEPIRAETAIVTAAETVEVHANGDQSAVRQGVSDACDDTPPDSGQSDTGAADSGSPYNGEKGRFKAGNPGRPKSTESEAGGDDSDVSLPELKRELRRTVSKLLKKATGSNLSALSQLLASVEKLSDMEQRTEPGVINLISNVPRPFNEPLAASPIRGPSVDVEQGNGASDESPGDVVTSHYPDGDQLVPPAATSLPEPEADPVCENCGEVVMPPLQECTACGTDLPQPARPLPTSAWSTVGGQPALDRAWSGVGGVVGGSLSGSGSLWKTPSGSLLEIEIDIDN